MARHALRGGAGRLGGRDIAGPRHGELRLVAASDEEPRLLELFALQRDQGPSMQCSRSGTAATNIGLTHPAATTEWARFTARARTTGFATTHAIPLRLRHRTVGALNLFHTEISRLSDEDTALAQALADISTIAILRQRTR